MDYIKLRARLDEVLAGQHDNDFGDLFSKVHCMSRPRVYAVINALVSCMDLGEVYAECGTYQGGSMIAALTGNNAQAIGIDNFAEFNTTNSYERTLKNFEDFGVSNRVTLRNMGYQQFFAEVRSDFEIAVYNYDGEHNYEGQLAGMEAAWPHLRSGSVIIVDDFLYPEVSRAINQFISNHIDRIKILVAIDSMKDCDEVWWNGAIALRVV